MSIRYVRVSPAGTSELVGAAPCREPDLSALKIRNSAIHSEGWDAMGAAMALVARFELNLSPYVGHGGARATQTADPGARADRTRCGANVPAGRGDCRPHCDFYLEGVDARRLRLARGLVLVGRPQGSLGRASTGDRYTDRRRNGPRLFELPLNSSGYMETRRPSCLCYVTPTRAAWVVAKLEDSDAAAPCG